MLKSSSYLILEKFIRLALGVVVTAFVARHLGPEDFGTLSFALAVQAILSVACAAGSNRIYIREVTRLVSQKEIEFFTFQIIALRLFITAMTTVSVAAYFLLAGNMVCAVVVVSAFFSFSEIVDLRHQAMGKFGVISAVRVIVSIVFALTKLYMVFFSVELLYFALLVPVETVVVAIIFWNIYFRRFGFYQVPRLGALIFGARKVFSESMYELLAGVAGIAFIRSDQIMIASMLGAEATGIYSAAVRISEAWYFIPAAIVSATYPDVVKKLDLDRVAGNGSLLRILSLLYVVSGVAVVMGTCFSARLIGVLYGKDFSGAALVLNIHLWSGFFMCMGVVSGSYLAASGQLRYNFFRQLFGLAVNLILNVPLIRNYGISGAAYATLASLFFAYFVFDLFSPGGRILARLKVMAIYKAPSLLLGKK